MTRATSGTCFAFIALLMLAIGTAAQPAHATSVGLIATGDAYADTISSTGPTFNADYDFQLDGSGGGVTVLATGFGQTSSTTGVDLLELALYDSASNLIASAAGSPIAFFDSFAQSGLALGAGSYLLTVFGQVTAGKQAFVSVSIAANVAQTPIPAAGLLLLSGLGALGGIAARRRTKANAI
ncbi:FxDxF family PEP-CTERM protein [Dongia sp.]|uniref:FxDxF family PEP-CTERM protein n=1 Tax=Dongia sp. TaxID=1977262 RepID=UPI003753389B